MNAQRFDRQMANLARASARNYIDPEQLAWPEDVDPEQWHFTPELISIYGTPTWDGLDDAARKRLSFFETVGFFSLNVHGEKYLVSEIGRRLYRDPDPGLNRYLLHFIEEEARHMRYFGRFCQDYAGRIYPDNTLALDPDDDSDLGGLMLFARIYLFEEIVDEYNRVIAADQRVSPTVREINRIHHVEESRHLAFGRKYLDRLLEQASDALGAEERERIAEHLAAYRDMLWKLYYNPAVYRDAGIEDCFAVRAQALEDPRTRLRRREIESRRLGYLVELGLLEAPS